MREFDDIQQEDSRPRRRKRRQEEEVVVKNGMHPLLIIGIIVVGITATSLVIAALCFASLADSSGLTGNTSMRINVDPEFQKAGITFGPWKDFGSAYTTVVSLSADAKKPLHKDRILVKCHGMHGLVMKDGFSTFTTIKPGEQARIDIYPSSMRDLAAVSLELKDD